LRGALTGPLLPSRHRGAGIRAGRAHEPLGELDRAHRILGVPVGADVLGPRTGDRGAANHHLERRPEPRLLERRDHRALAGHRGRQERGKADDVGPLLAGGRDEALRGDIDAEVVDLEAGRREEHAHEVLADLVDVAGNGADDDAAGDGPLGGAGLELGLEHAEGTLHGPGRQHHVGQEEVARGESGPNFLHAGHEALVDGGQGRDAGRDGRTGGDLGGVGIAVDDCLAHGLELGVGHGTAPWCVAGDGVVRVG
jgi:hypothetical protein